jgi:hypothetical protein
MVWLLIMLTVSFGNVCARAESAANRTVKAVATINRVADEHLKAIPFASLLLH